MSSSLTRPLIPSIPPTQSTQIEQIDQPTRRERRRKPDRNFSSGVRRHQRDRISSSRVRRRQRDRISSSIVPPPPPIGDPLNPSPAMQIDEESAFYHPLTHESIPPSGGVIQIPDSPSDDVEVITISDNEEQPTIPDICVICRDDSTKIDHACIPCGHKKYCKTCADRLKRTKPPSGLRCPYCRTPCIGIYKIIE